VSEEELYNDDTDFKLDNYDKQYELSFYCAIHHGRQRLYVCDKNNSQIHIFNILKNKPYHVTYVRSFGNDVLTRDPYGITVHDSMDQVYVVDKNTSSICVFTGDGDFINTWEYQLKDPCGICVDEKNNLLFLTDTLNHRICIIEAISGRFLRYIESRHSFYPSGVWYDQCTATLYVDDNDDDTIQVYELS
jgi:DNA-binding beta-propeller fold protein YncE